MNPRGRWAAALVGVVAFAACDESDVHLYSAQQFKFDPTGPCVEAPVVIDVINGGSTSVGCAPECLVAPPDQCGNQAIFVSTQCGPYPEGLVTEGQGDVGDASVLCAPAFKAFAAFAADGGECPPSSADAGDAEAGCAADAGDAGAGDAMTGDD